MDQPRVRKYKFKVSPDTARRAGIAIGRSGLQWPPSSVAFATARRQAEEAVYPVNDYAAFEREFMRIVESEAARKIIEEGL